MSREIKFRAWHKDLKKMTLPFTLADLYDLCVYQYNFTDGEYLCTDEMEYNELEFMQYTGLKDKNGKEIYEGDIIQAIKQEQNGSNSYEIKDIVAFRAGGFKVFGRCMQSCNTQQDCMTIKNFMWCQQGHMNIPNIWYEILKVEIIGNIYENPELLKESER
jgi:uncharacterized phage protein (TIGR01671 family)